VIEDAVAKNVVPGVGKKPEAGGYMRAHGRAFRPRRPLTLTTLHFRPHLGIHFFERNVADPLLGHFLASLAILSVRGRYAIRLDKHSMAENTPEIEVDRGLSAGDTPGRQITVFVVRHRQIDESAVTLLPVR
jgi:hypothetical protein